ncbi:MAG: polyamine aminopropyltransferase [Planctomycetes bacterium]|nr:polyamine aminopropyltransferase [Planctomycetota bacterium]
MNRSFFLFLNVLIIATCGLVYELLAGTAASYLLGDTVFQFSTVIGVYLFAMGVGSWLSRFIDKQLAWVFVEVELAVALLGGLASPIFFLGHAYLSFFQVVLYAVVFLIGTLVGLEIPLLMRILEGTIEFKDLVSRVLAFDYVGALIASLAFPMLLLPSLGIMRTSLAIGIVNALVGLWATWLLRPQIKGSVTALRARAILVIVLLGVGIVFSNRLILFAEEGIYADPVVFTRTTPYQRIVVTRGTGGVFRLYLNGHLQFNSVDEYRYHEALVHPAMAAVVSPKRVLVLGGGDGLALREVLRHPNVESVTLVDLDPGMTRLSDRYPPLGQLNEQAYHDAKVRVVNEDAYIWVQKAPPDGRPFDVILIDFPDPHSYALGKLYTTHFYRLLKRHLTRDGAIAVQCTSPFMAPKTFWCIVKTLEASGYRVKPYHVAVPSFFGVWGFSLAKREEDELKVPERVPRDLRRPDGTPVRLRFLNDDALKAMFVFPEDMQLPADEKVEVNRLDNQVVVQYHEAEWKRYVR